MVAGESEGATLDMSNFQEVSISFEISSATAIINVASNGTNARIEVPTRIERNSLIIELGNNESFVLNTDKNSWLSLEDNGSTLYFARTDISSEFDASESALTDAESLAVALESETRVLEQPKEFSDYVYDYANVISAPDASMINEYAKITELIGAGQVIVVTVKTLSGMTAEDYAFELFNSWGIGSAKDNDGILILFAPNERSIQITTGSGIDTQITNQDCGMLLDNFAIPYLAKNEFSDGLLSLAKATCTELVLDRCILFADPEMPHIHINDSESFYSSLDTEKLYQHYYSTLAEILHRSNPSVTIPQTGTTEILFRNIPWGVNPERYLSELSSIGYKPSIEKATMRSFEAGFWSDTIKELYEVEEAGYKAKVSTKDFLVAGYPVTETGAYFSYGFDENNVYFNQSNSHLYLAYYEFDPVDFASAYESLTKKLEYLYGSGTPHSESSGWITGNLHNVAHTEWIVWYGKNDTAAYLWYNYRQYDDGRKYNEKLSLYYGKSNSISTLQNLKAAMTREQLKESASDLSGL